MTPDWSTRLEGLEQQDRCHRNKDVIGSWRDGFARIRLAFPISKQITNENNQWLLLAVAAFLCKVTDGFLLAQSNKEIMKRQRRSMAVWSRFLGLLLIFLAILPGFQGKKSKCQKITIPLCANIGYNTTRFPNFLGQENEEDAASKIQEFTPLVAVNCAPQLRFFLCSVFAPMCAEGIDRPIYSCRSMCEAARNGCTPVMQKFGFDWPGTLDCNLMPYQGDPRAKSDPSKLCMAPQNLEHRPINMTELLKNVDNMDPTYRDLLERLGKLPGPWATVKSTAAPTTEYDTGQMDPNNTSVGAISTLAMCRNDTRNVLSKSFIRVDKYEDEICVPRCGEDVYFTASNRRFVETWVTVWSVLCFISTTITVLTFAIDTSRFKYPERPIIFLSLCYNLYSMAYIVRAIAGTEKIICDKERQYVVTAGMNIADHAGCSVVFLMLYYFGMASALWWVALTFAWFLAAGLKWGQEAIEAKATYFHIVAWTVPAVQTIIVLILRKVDADELSGLCYVGNSDKRNLGAYVLAPLSLYLILGTLFLLAGFIALFRIRMVLKNKETDTNKLEKLMVRIGVFSVLYTVPVTAVVACYFYEHANMERWRLNVLRCQGVESCVEEQGPSVELFTVKYFMLLAVGITSNMWIWSTKTFQAWRGFYQKKCAGGDEKSAEKKPLTQASQNSFKNNQGRVAANTNFPYAFNAPAPYPQSASTAATSVAVPSPSLPQSKASSVAAGATV